MKLDLGSCSWPQEGYLGVDIRPFKNVSVVADLSKGWPFKDNSIDELRASHVFEHLPDTIHTLAEALRVLRPGGVCRIEVPSTEGPGAFQDPTHKSFWNLNTFMYLDRNLSYGAPYECNRWVVEGVAEYTNPTIVQWGPYVTALLRKPAA